MRGANREQLVCAACVELLEFFKKARLPYPLKLEVLARVTDEIQDKASEMTPSWSEANWRKDTRIHVEE